MTTVATAPVDVAARLAWHVDVVKAVPAHRVNPRLRLLALIAAGRRHRTR